MPGCWAVALGIALTALLAGCLTGPKYTDLTDENVGTTFHIGDLVTVSFIGQSGGIDILPPASQRIAEDLA